MLDGWWRERWGTASGILVTRAHTFTIPVSRVPVLLEKTLAEVPGVTAVVPEIWTLTANNTILIGADPEKMARLRGGGVFAQGLVEGRMPRDATEVLLPRSLLGGKKIGSRCNVLDRDLTITGTFRTGSPVFDDMLVGHESTVRSIAELPSSVVTCFFLEVAPGEDADLVARRVTARLPKRASAESIASWGGGYSRVIRRLDVFLLAIGILAAGIGAIGVVSTMLMSVRERVREFGILQATGWKRRDVFRLIVIESAVLGAASGVLGVGAGAFAAHQLARSLALAPVIPLWLVLATASGSFVLGIVSGLYPAFAASRLDPITAISMS